MKIFITGTDTNVGKTLVSAWLCVHSGADYWKPVQAGTEPETDSAVVARLSGARVHAETWRLALPASPHLAAQRAGVQIQLQDFQMPAAEKLIIEGAGGALVPLNERDVMTDLIEKLDCPVIVVARSTLGTINHTCLTLETLRARKLTVLGVVMSGEPNADNRAAIEHYGRVPVLAQLPFLTKPSRAALQSIKPNEALRKFLV